MRPMSAFEARRWSVIRYMAVDDAPYLAPALFQLVPTVAEAGDTVAVSLSGRVALPFDDMSDVELSVLVRHAVWHVLRAHHRRLGGLADQALAGFCGCLEINDDEPDAHPHPHDVDLPDGLVAEEYYRLLHDPASDGPSPQGCSLDDIDGDIDGDDALDVEGLAVQVALAVIEHARANPGNVPGSLVRWADGKVAPAVVPWDVQFGAWTSRIADRASGRDDFSYSRPSRRGTGDDGLIRAGMIGALPRVGVVVDTSGSMDDQAIVDAVAEVVGLVDAVGEAIVVSCDAESSTPKVLDRWSGITGLRLTGGGGTDMGAGIAAVCAVIDRPVDGVVVITDGLTDWPAASPGVPMVVVMVGGADVAVPGYATVVRL